MKNNNPSCRFCKNILRHKFIDLGMSPLANSYLTEKQLLEKESFYPLEVYVCDNCFLAQLQEFESPEKIFGDYAYFSSYSDTWLKHAEEYTDKMTKMLSLDVRSFVIEIASNDGYLLQYFMQKKIPVLGIEPAKNVAEVARQKGIPTEVMFFGSNAAKTLSSNKKYADLILGNNVLAHVPDINDFVAGLKFFLKPSGIITMEFPHLMRLIEEVQFDTIYHEHFSYFSLLAVDSIFSKHGLVIFDAEELSTHGGSLRIYAKHKEDTSRTISDRVTGLKQLELEKGYKDIDFYMIFGEKVKAVKRDIVTFLIQAKNEGKSIAGYGAAAKGNTLLNYCGVRMDFIDYVADKSPHKQGCYLPGSHIPIYGPEKIKETRPDYVMILPWNLKNEIIEQLSFIREWKGKFVIPIPKIQVV